MQRRTVVYVSGSLGKTGTYPELLQRLQEAVEDRGDVVVGTFSDHTADGRGRMRHAGWKALLGALDGADQVAVHSAADLPGKTIKNLLAALGHLRDRGVGLYLAAEGIDTGCGTAFTMLDIISAFRRAKLSAAIRAGQAKSGKKVGRPEVPASVRQRIQAALAGGAGIRPTARRFGCSPGTVINLRRSMAEISAQAA